MIDLNKQLSFDEKNLFNPAYVGILLFQSIREYQIKSGNGLHCSLTYIIAPMSISPRYTTILPTTMSTHLTSWTNENEGNLIGFDKAVSSYVDIVNSAMILLIEKQIIILNNDGNYYLTDIEFPKKPTYVFKNKRFKESYLSAGLLGRWFSQASSVESIFIQLGIKP